MEIYRYLDYIAWKFKYWKKPFQKFINELYWNPYIISAQKKEIDYITFKGFKFLPTECLDTLAEAPNWLDNIRETDVVFNIGACIGSVAIPIANKCKKVIAIEPVWNTELDANVKLNGLENKVVVGPIAIRSAFEGTRGCRYGSKIIDTDSMSFRSLIAKTGKPDYLVCDIEGDEWDIDLRDLLGIREVRIELHVRRDHKKWDYWKLNDIEEFLECNGYTTSILPIHHTNPSIMFKEVIYFKASKI